VLAIIPRPTPDAGYLVFKEPDGTFRRLSNDGTSAEVAEPVPILGELSPREAAVLYLPPDELFDTKFMWRYFELLTDAWNYVRNESILHVLHEPGLPATLTPSQRTLLSFYSSELLLTTLKDVRPARRRAAAQSLGVLQRVADAEAIAALLDDPEPSVVDAAVLGLMSIGGEATMPVVTRGAAAVGSLAKVLDAASDSALVRLPLEHAREQAFQVLVRIGSPAVPQLVRRLDHVTLGTPSANALLSMGAEGRAGLIASLRRLDAASLVALAALVKSGWQPSRPDDVVFLHLNIRDDTGSITHSRTTSSQWISANAGDVARVLVSTLIGDEDLPSEGLVRALIRLGDPATVPTLRAHLQRRGTSRDAVLYLNSGNDELRETALEWARKNGYRVTSIRGGVRARWGQDR
jgi:HEAT repeat protein